MDEFSIELAAERINDVRTREYFREVLLSLVNGSHRSAVVMLWSIIVADLVYKLQDLRDLFGDPTARAILESVDQKQKANPNNPDWEGQLVDDVNSRMSLLEPADYQNLVQLQKLRNLSAHPVLNATNILFSPNKETARAAIRNALEGVLLKPPIFSKKIVSEFVADLAAKKSLLPDRESLTSYLDAKYFKSLHPEVERELFKALWKFSFRLENDDTDANRDVNTRTLEILFERKPLEFKALVQAQQAFFSELSEGAPLDGAIHFLSTHPSLFEALSPAARVLVENRARGVIDYFAKAVFLSDGLPAHVEAVRAHQLRCDLQPRVFDELMVAARQAGCANRLCLLGAEIYGNSQNFNDADHRFARFVEPYLPDYDAAALQRLLEQIEDNGQLYNRGRARTDHPKVKQRCDEVLGPAFDLSRYFHFNRNLV